MKAFDVESFVSPVTYKKFIKYMLENSEYFSLIYFKYKDSEKMKKSTRKIHDKLKKFKVCSKNTMKWPGTETFDTQHFYKIVLYASNIECLDSISETEDIFNWNYPKFPMDLCFYRNGYCWFATSSHERMAVLYTDSMEEIKELGTLGVDINFYDEENPIFLNEIFNEKETKRDYRNRKI